MKEKNIFGLVEYNRQDFFDDTTDEIRFADRFYIMTEADAVLKGQQELIAEKDEEIAELKKKLMPCLNGDCILTCEVVEKYGKENAELKAKLEDAKATAYTESVDAGMRERRLKRELYNLRAVYADMMQKRYIECKTDGWVHRVDKWIEVERRCLKKAEEYK